jgi:hypothetical protein
VVPGEESLLLELVRAAASKRVAAWAASVDIFSDHAKRRRADIRAEVLDSQREALLAWIP